MKTRPNLNPIVYETRVQRIDGEEIHITGSRSGDTCNLSTGEIGVAQARDLPAEIRLPVH